LATGANFINILWAPFSYERLLAAFFYLLFDFVIFGANFLYEKRPHKMLMKLTPALLFGNTSMSNEKSQTGKKKLRVFYTKELELLLP
jgi:hypothetical protein